MEAVTPSFFFSSRRRHTRWNCDWSSDVCSSDLVRLPARRIAIVVRDRLAVHRQSIVGQQSVLCELADDDGKTTRLEEVLHQVAARRHDVDEAIDAAAKPISVVERKIDADSARNRD